MADLCELLFFDTFSHESSEELNLDLVQFPKPVVVSEVRIIPLGARVQADFPGGVRLGATNPSQFSIEFFVNDLGKPGASTFESLGGFEYSQNGKIHLECVGCGEPLRQIPTDGLVLRGWYTTITLAVYGTLTNNIAEQIIPPPISSVQPVPTVVHQIIVPETQQSLGPLANPDWQQEIANPIIPIDSYAQSVATSADMYTANYPENYENQVYQNTYYSTEVPKDPRSFQHVVGEPAHWERDPKPLELERIVQMHEEPQTSRDRDPRARSRDHNILRAASIERSRPVSRHREHSRGYSRSPSHERDYKKRDYRSRSPSSEYRAPYVQKRELRSRGPSYERTRSYDRTTESSYEHRSPDDIRKRPRTPPLLDQSPRRPHTPDHGPVTLNLSPVDSVLSEEERHEYEIRQYKVDIYNKHTKLGMRNDTYEKVALDLEDKARLKLLSPSLNTGTPLVSPAAVNDDGLSADGEQFEPILSDEDIADETDSQLADMDYALAEDSEIDDVIKQFNPFNMEIVKHKREIRIEQDDNLAGLLEVLNAAPKNYTVTNFEEMSAECKEEWVHNVEQIPVFLACITKDGMASLLEDTSSLQLLLTWLEIGLNFDLAVSQVQPGYKIRHIKSGIRLAEGLCTEYAVTEQLLQRGVNVFVRLIELYNKDYMALSIKLMILKALDSTLSTSKAVDFFLQCDKLPYSKEIDKVKIENCNGYQALVQILQNNPLTRVKFALKSIIKKLNLYEMLKRLRVIVISWGKSEVKSESGILEIADNEIDLVAQIFKEINTIYCEPLSLAHPKRFLPVSSQFDASACNQHDKSALFDFFTSKCLLECISLILNHPIASAVTNLITPALELLSTLSKDHAGLVYLSERIDVINLIIRSLLQTSAQTDEDFVDSLSQNLGLELAYKLQTLYHVECISDLNKNNDEFLDQLHLLFCMCLNNYGKLHMADVLAMADNLKIFLNIFDYCDKQLEVKEDMANKFKSPALGYATDLIDLTVRNANDITYLQRHGRKLIDLTRQHEFYEPAISSKLQEIALYLRPIENVNVFNYDDITLLCECISRSAEHVSSFPGDLITCLRILKHISISPHDGFNASEHVELKYKYVTLQLYSADGITLLINIMDRICNHFSQPGLHSSTFVTTQGLLITQVILPSSQLLRKMLTYVISCRNTAFKDLTAVNVLLQTYSLMYSYPANAIAYPYAQQICVEIINTLLAYTQPVSLEVTETDSIHKSSWTLLIGEIVKFIMSGPSSFMPGLLVLSELLPLPLPILSRQPLQEEEITRIVTARRLWSAHLHCQSAAISEMIQTLCQSSFQPLLQILRKVCVQLADLAPNMTLIVSKTLIDLLLQDPVQGQCSAQSARFLYFLACLVPHGSMKAAVLSVLNNGLTSFMCHVLRTPGDSNSHLQAQDCVLSIIQILCVSEIKLSSDTTNVDIFLANVLPAKESFTQLISAVIEHAVMPNSINCLVACIRTMIMFTEQDYGFYHLKTFLEKVPSPVYSILTKIARSFKETPECLTALSAVVEMLRLLMITEEIEGACCQRTYVLTSSELISIVGWSDKADHPIREIEKLLQECSEDEGCVVLLESLKGLVDILERPGETVETTESMVEPVLPSAEPLLVQFAARAVWGPEVTEERLTTSYWLSAPPCDDDLEMDQVSFDLSELVRTLLPPETNIFADCKRVLHLSQSPLAARERPTTTPMFRTRKMNVEPSTGRPDKRLFVTPMRGRGFPRAPPVRGGDLFRSRPPNTSRPPSLHVDDFVALETCGAQPTGPTGYNKLSREIISSRGTQRVRRGGTMQGYRPLRGRGSAWPTSHIPESGHFRSATLEPQGGHFGEPQQHFTGGHFVSAGAPRGRGPSHRGHLRTFTR